MQSASNLGSQVQGALAGARALYFLPRDNLAKEVLIPAFAETRSAKCMVGFFSSAVLRDLAPGLATFLNRGGEPFKLVFSPFLSKEDQAALAEGVRTPDQIAEASTAQLLVTTDELERYTLRCLSHLIATGRIQVQIAIMKDALFHPKVWLFQTEQGDVAVHGSSNMTHAAIHKNKEQITVSKSWVDPTQRYIVEKLSDEFEGLWKGTDQDCWVVGLPEAVQKNLMREYRSEKPPTESDFLELQARSAAEKIAAAPIPMPQEKTFKIPPWLRYDDGDFAHQGEAVRNWEAAGYRGTLEMATGSGKTLTSMIATYRLFQKHSPLLVVVAAP